MENNEENKVIQTKEDLKNTLIGLAFLVIIGIIVFNIFFNNNSSKIEDIALNCAYTRISYIAEKTGNVLRESEIIEKDNYGRYLAHFKIDLLVSGSYKTANYYIIVWNVKENGEFMYSPKNEMSVSFYNATNNDTIEYAKKLYNWNEPISD